MLTQVTGPASPPATVLAITWRRAAEGDQFTGRDGHRWTITDITHWRTAGCVVTAVRTDGKTFRSAVDPDGPVSIEPDTAELDAIRLAQVELGGTVTHRGRA